MHPLHYIYIYELGKEGGNYIYDLGNEVGHYFYDLGMEVGLGGYCGEMGALSSARCEGAEGLKISEYV